MTEYAMKVIGLTGGIGSGKSTVSAYLTAKGFPVIDADAIAREIVLPGSTVLEKLVSVFGGGILEEEGGLNRKKMAQMIFEDVQQKERLESIMHEEVARQMDMRIEQLRRSQAYRAVFLDVPLLFESKSNLSDKTHEIWVVDAEDELRIERVQRRDGSTKEEILARMRNQMSRQEKNKRAHKIIENSGSEDQLFQQVDRLIEKL